MSTSTSVAKVGTAAASSMWCTTACWTRESGSTFAPVPPSLVAASTSSRVIMPFGPLPWMLARSTPSSRAIRRAIGEALPRTSRAGGGAAAGGSGVALSVGADGAVTASPGAPICAMGAPIGAASPSETRIASSVPGSSASYSIVALSVSISTSGWPCSTESPTATSHFATVPSSIESESRGMTISTAIGGVLS